jgi:putative membrane protein
MNFFGAVVRFIVAAIVIWFTGLLVPGFQVAGFWTALMAAVVIALLGWAIEALFKRDISPFGRGLVGFATSAAIIYVTQFFVTGFTVSLIGAILAALVIGIIDMFIPTRGAFGKEKREAR